MHKLVVDDWTPLVVGGSWVLGGGTAGGSGILGVENGN